MKIEWLRFLNAHSVREAGRVINTCPTCSNSMSHRYFEVCVCFNSFNLQAASVRAEKATNQPNVASTLSLSKVITPGAISIDQSLHYDGAEYSEKRVPYVQSFIESLTVNKQHVKSSTDLHVITTRETA